MFIRLEAAAKIELNWSKNMFFTESRNREISSLRKIIM